MFVNVYVTIVWCITVKRQIARPLLSSACGPEYNFSINIAGT